MLEGVENILDTIKYRLRVRYGIQQLRVVVYPGYRNESHAFIRGRVLVGKDIETGREDHGLWRNFGNMLKRFLSAEIARALLEVHWEGRVAALECDHEGFFFADLPLENAEAHPEIRVSVVEPSVSRPVEAVAPVVWLSDHAELVVVSDVDDTVIVTWATRLWRMIRLTFFGNAATRKPFAGVADWYRALQKGPGGDGANPIFYVSSSPWNLYDFIEEFLDYNDIPSGPLFLRDHGLFSGRGVFDHRTHKLDAVQRLLRAYPDQQFLLIGDSGQKDPEIYRDLVKENPERFRGVLIRNVSHLLPVRVTEVERVGGEITKMGVRFRLFDRTDKAVESTREWGLTL